MFAVGTVSQGEKHIESAGSGLIMCTGKRLAIVCPVTICLQNIGLCQPAQWASPNMVRRHKPQHSKNVLMQSHTSCIPCLCRHNGCWSNQCLGHGALAGGIRHSPIAFRQGSLISKGLKRGEWVALAGEHHASGLRKVSRG